jgi:hypothetical protein
MGRLWRLTGIAGTASPEGELADTNKIDQLRYLLLRDEFGASQRVQLGTVVSADAGARVTIAEKGAAARDADLRDLKGVHVVGSFSGRFTSPEAEVRWFDTAGQLATARLKGFKGTGFKFSLQRLEPPKEQVH